MVLPLGTDLMHRQEYLPRPLLLKYPMTGGNPFQEFLILQVTSPVQVILTAHQKEDMGLQVTHTGLRPTDILK